MSGVMSGITNGVGNAVANGSRQGIRQGEREIVQTTYEEVLAVRNRLREQLAGVENQLFILGRVMEKIIGAEKEMEAQPEPEPPQATGLDFMGLAPTLTEEEVEELTREPVETGEKENDAPDPVARVGLSAGPSPELRHRR